MPIYIRFENSRQVETGVMENRPEGWYEAPKDFDWQKSYCLTEGGEIVERTKEDIQQELLDNAKFGALDSLHFYFDNFTHGYSGRSHQKAKSYEIQAKAAENILAKPESIDEKDLKIIEPLAKVREISVVDMAKLIQGKAKKAVKAIAKCEELEDTAKKKIKEIKSEEELYNFLDNLKLQIKDSLKDL
ncbi:MAG: hypothetical protein QWI36_04725 [Wolbachia endosymbiont of Tyrophagus putrescentiae]|nr:hypothetical protein [Wolbachia endosymbiont of Tyrophagus putrescentiae]